MTKARWAQLFLYSFTLLVGVASLKLASAPPPMPVTHVAPQATLAYYLWAELTSSSTSPRVISTPLPFPTMTSPNLVVIGRLDRLTASSYCGYIPYAGVAEYSDLRIIDGTYIHDAVFVIHYCPLEQNLRLGDYYQLHLTLQNIFNIATIEVGDIMLPSRMDERYCTAIAPSASYMELGNYICTVESLVASQQGQMYFSEK